MVDEIEILKKQAAHAEAQSRECWRLAEGNPNSHFVGEARYWLGRKAAFDETIIIMTVLKGANQ